MAEINETNDNKKLKDSLLDKVSGGGSGDLSKGVYSETYTEVEDNTYYCFDEYPKDGTRIFYIQYVTYFGSVLTGVGSREILHMDDNHWWTEWELNDRYNIEQLKRDRPYKLNVRP